MKRPNYHRLEIWWVKLDPARGNEAKKRCDPAPTTGARQRRFGFPIRGQAPHVRAPRQTRPCLILQNDVGNQFSDITMVVPFLEPKPYPFVVNVKPTKYNGLDRQRGLNFSQIRVAHYSRFVNKLGILEDSYLPQIENAIAIELNIFGR